MALWPWPFFCWPQKQSLYLTRASVLFSWKALGLMVLQLLSGNVFTFKFFDLELLPTDPKMTAFFNQYWRLWVQWYFSYSAETVFTFKSVWPWQADPQNNKIFILNKSNHPIKFDGCESRRYFSHWTETKCDIRTDRRMDKAKTDMGIDIKMINMSQIWSCIWNVAFLWNMIWHNELSYSSETR